MGSTTAETRRVLIIGLDSAPPELVFDRLLAEMPTVRGLMAEGVYGPLESTIPAITVPAWSSMMTGLDPGQLGFYGFRNRADYSYRQMTIANASDVRQPRIWDRLSRSGKRVGIVGVPQTFPVQPVNGQAVSCFLTPSAKSQYTYPPEFRGEIASWIGTEEFLVDVPNFRSEDKDQILADIYRLADQHFEVCRRLLERERYDFFMTVDMGLDRIHHAFWKYMDPGHPKHEPGNRFEQAIPEYYRYLDDRIGELVERAGDDAVVLVVSDHGSKRMAGGICINEWLIEQGYLALVETPSRSTPLEACEVDWGRTRAWAAGGYYGRLFLNVAGREPNGAIDPAAYEAERDELIGRLATITDPGGRPIGVVGYKPEEIYAEVNNIPPDLILYFGDLDWRAVGSVGIGSTWTFENDTGPDDANHAQHGIFVLRDPARPGGGRQLEGLRIYDVAPTVMAALGTPLPADGLQGREILW